MSSVLLSDLKTDLSLFNLLFHIEHVGCLWPILIYVSFSLFLIHILNLGTERLLVILYCNVI